MNKNETEVGLITGGFMMGLIVSAKIMSEPETAAHLTAVASALNHYASSEMEKLTGQAAEDIAASLGDRVDEINRQIKAK